MRGIVRNAGFACFLGLSARSRESFFRLRDATGECGSLGGEPLDRGIKIRVRSLDFEELVSLIRLLAVERQCLVPKLKEDSLSLFDSRSRRARISLSFLFSASRRSRNSRLEIAPGLVDGAGWACRSSSTSFRSRASSAALSRMAPRSDLSRFSAACAVSDSLASTTSFRFRPLEIRSCPLQLCLSGTELIPRPF